MAATKLIRHIKKYIGVRKKEKEMTALKKIAIALPANEVHLFELCEKYISEELAGEEFEIKRYYEDTLLDEMMAKGCMTEEFSRRAFDIFETAAKDNADAILVGCSTIGDVSRKAAALYELMGLPLISLDDPAAEKAVEVGKRIGMLVNLDTTIDISRKNLERIAKGKNKKIEVVVGFEQVFGMGKEKIKNSLIKNCKNIASKVDVIFLCQPSMTEWADEIQKEVDVPVISILDHAAKTVREKIF